jgi:hypothetical protein
MTSTLESPFTETKQKIQPGRLVYNKNLFQNKNRKSLNSKKSEGKTPSLNILILIFFLDKKSESRFQPSYSVVYISSNGLFV